MVQLAALGLQNPQIDTLGAFKQGAATAAGIDEAKRQAAEKSLQLVGAASMHALGGKIDGTPDPAKFEEGLDMLQDMGIDVTKFRGKPQMASVAARASMSALQQLNLAQDDRQFEYLMQKFGADLMQADRQYALERETLDFNKSKAVRGDVPNGYRQTADGGLEPIPGGPSDPENPLNRNKTAMNGAVTIDAEGNITVGGKLQEGQAKTAGYAERMIKAEGELSSAPDGETPIMESARPGLSSANPISGDFWEMLNRKYGPNMTQSPEYQRFVTGAQEWVRAKLRKESGAAISNSEWESEFATYFPQPGDTPDRVKMKERLRATAVDSMKAESRGGYEALFGIRDRQAKGEPIVEGGEQPDELEGKTIINRKTGERMVRQNGQWVPAQ